jgi:hemolysin activation/secretion protein
MKIVLTSFLGCCFLFVASMVVAQQPPEAGTIMREIEKPESEQKWYEEEVSYEPEKAKKVKKMDKTIFVKGFKFTSTRVLPKEKLKNLLKSYVGRNVNLAELDIATSIIVEYYTKKGYVVKVIIPPQEIKEGIIEIKIIVGHYEGCKVGGKKTRFKKSIATRVINNTQKGSTALNIDKLESGLLILNDMPGVQATSFLRPGNKEGGVMVDLDVKDTSLLKGNVDYDNYGIYSVGAHRGIIGLNLDDPLSISDQLSGNFIYSGLLNYESLAYSLPVGDSGMRLGLSSSILYYRLGEEWNALNGKGNAFTMGSHFSYPLIRSRIKNIQLLASCYHKKFVNYSLGTTTSDKVLNVGHVSFAASAYDQFLGGGYTMWWLSGALGKLDLKGNQSNYTIDQAGPKTNGTYSKLVFLISRVQRITDKTSLELKIRGQYAFHNLDSSEQFDLGGPDAVRGYGSSDANGDHGAIATMGLSRELGYGFKIAGFYDFGYIVQHYKAYAGWQAAGSLGNTYALGSVGGGIEWKPTNKFLNKVSIIAATKHSPFIKNELKQSDVNEKNFRIWFQVNAVF